MLTENRQRAFLVIGLALFLSLQGCASQPAEDESFPESRLLLGHEEVVYEVDQPPHERQSAWRGALCKAQEQALGALRSEVTDVVTDAWARVAALDGNDLPPLTQSRRETWVAGIMDSSRLLGLGEVTPGQVEAYQGLEVPEALSECLADVARGARDAKSCAQSPRRPAQVGCEERDPRPQRLYFLQ